MCGRVARGGGGQVVPGAGGRAALGDGGRAAPGPDGGRASLGGGGRAVLGGWGWDRTTSRCYQGSLSLTEIFVVSSNMLIPSLSCLEFFVTMLTFKRETMSTTSVVFVFIK